jgi:hypothetical protein
MSRSRFDAGPDECAVPTLLVSPGAPLFCAIEMAGAATMMTAASAAIADGLVIGGSRVAGFGVQERRIVGLRYRADRRLQLAGDRERDIDAVLVMLKLEAAIGHLLRTEPGNVATASRRLDRKLHDETRNRAIGEDPPELCDLGVGP